jgi:uncharacterized repeat protein (TIGR01451 family)
LLSLTMSAFSVGFAACGRGARRSGRWLIRARGGVLGVASRLTAAFMTIVGVALVGVAVMVPAAAYANAPNPEPDTTANVTVYNTATTLPDGQTAPAGAVTINLSGIWNWATVNGPQDCDGRYGEGLSVDWWGGKSSATLLDASEAIPTASNTESLAYGDISPSGGLTTSSGTFPFSADSSGSVIFNGWNTNTASEPQSDWTTSGPGATVGCTDVGSGSIGPWSATATYPSTADVPPQICVILYDMHGTEGGTSNPGSVNPTDNDNSIQTNAYDPSAGAGYCFSSNFVPSLSVAKTGPTTGNPNGTGTYHLVVTNSGSAPASDVTVTDTLPSGETYQSFAAGTGASGTTCSDTAGTGTSLTGTGPGLSSVLSCTIPGPIAAGGGTADIDVTVSYAATDAGTTQTDCATVSGQATPSCVPTTFPQTQALTGYIYLCQNGAQSTDVVPGGNLSASGAQTISPTGSSTLDATNVAAGDYTMSATAPTGYDFTACGSTATITTPGSATEGVTVPAGGTGTGTFYVTPVTQSLLGHIYVCLNGQPSKVEANGGLLSATGPQTISSTANPLSAAPVDAGTYTMSATAPTGYDFTACGSTATITTPGSATEGVTVPAGGTGTGTFYVTPTAAPSSSITLTVAKTNDAGGQGYAQIETAAGPGENVPFRVVVTNTSSTPVTITDISDSWPGQAAFSPACASSLDGTTLQPNASATCDFTANGYAPAAGASLTDTVTVTGCQATDASNCTTVPATSTVNTPPASTPVTPSSPATPTVTPSASPSSAVAVYQQPSRLAFTGTPEKLQLMMEIGLALLSAGMFILWGTRPRRLAGS